MDEGVSAPLRIGLFLMKTKLAKPTNAAKAAAPKRTTTLELDAETVAKLRAILKVTKKGPIESFLNDHLRGLVENEPIQNQIPATRSKILRIIAGDKRLVRPEPLPRNAVVYSNNMERLKTMNQNFAMPTNTALNCALDYFFKITSSGALQLVTTAPESGQLLSDK